MTAQVSLYKSIRYYVPASKQIKELPENSLQMVLESGILHNDDKKSYNG